MRFLEESGYIRKTGVKKTKAGFVSVIYELKARAYLSMILDSINLDALLPRMEEDNALAIFGEFVLNLIQNSP